MKILKAPVGEFREDPNNERDHPETNRAAIRASLQRFGQVEPLVVRAGTKTLIGGNGRIREMRELGMAEVSYVEFDGTDDEVTALRVALNRTGELARWDPEKLHASLKGLLGAKFDLSFTGFSMPEFRSIGVSAHRRSTGSTPDPGATPVPSTPDSAFGGLYLLGPHRLVCGDSTNPAAIDTALGGREAGGICTDPPHGILYVGGTTDALTIQNDDLSAEDLSAFAVKTFRVAFDRSLPGAWWYVFTPTSPEVMAFQRALLDLGVWRHSLVWEKDSLVLGGCDYHYRHEGILYGWTPGGSHTWLGDRKQSTVVEHPRPRSNSDHPTMKPPGLLARLIRNNAKPDDVVLDMFGGSGSTLIAAAQLGLSSSLVEISPGYCDVIRRRWTAWAKEADVDPGPGALGPKE